LFKKIVTMITVLRLGHRRTRDARISTHVGLVARAFGARRIVYSGEKDASLINSVKKVVKNWGGPFDASYEKNWRTVIKEFRGARVHLTMYGIPYQKMLGQLMKRKNLLIIVGGEKVPPDVYQMVDYNIAVTNQPHSEVAALGVFLDRLGRAPRFRRERLRVVPQERGKKFRSTSASLS
jgi:tRNA (cytidine56-2'-O)-methyltransferase